MVTRLSGHVAELGNMQRADRADLKALQEEVLRQLEDIRARLTMAEARDSVAALTRVADASAPVQPQRQERRAAAELPPGAPVLGPQSYVVTSASPFLAPIAHRNPRPNQPPPPELRLGDAVPGLGKVLGIAQEGTAWVVRTERGPITSGPVAPTNRLMKVVIAAATRVPTALVAMRGIGGPQHSSRMKAAMHS